MPKSFSSLTEAWISFEAAVIDPEDYPDEISEEMRRVFFCGAAAAMLVSGVSNMINNAADGMRISIDAMRALAICEEINAFGTSMKREAGYAEDDDG